MIDRAEVRRIAGRLGVDPLVVDHDYVLGCFLHFLALQDEVKAFWNFKGGTALAKCHFPEYRFSEDLDFTVTSAITEPLLVQIIDSAKAALQVSTGIRADFEKTRVEVLRDDYAQESFEGKFYYRGPWESGGSPRSVRIHVNREEKVIFAPQIKSIIHNFSDKHNLPKTALKVYALEEVFVEKLRAFSGQRKFAIARDLFDLHYLSQHDVDVEAVIGAFEIKCQVKSIQITDLSLNRILDREKEFQANWKNQLEYLIPKELKIPFEEVWNKSLILIERVIK